MKKILEKKGTCLMCQMEGEIIMPNEEQRYIEVFREMGEVKTSVKNIEGHIKEIVDKINTIVDKTGALETDVGILHDRGKRTNQKIGWIVLLAIAVVNAVEYILDLLWSKG